MTSPNLDLVRSIYADWERGDFRRTDWADPDIEFVIVGGPDPGTWAGISAMSDAWRAWLSAWEDWTAEPEEYRELDSGRVLVLTTGRGRGKSSGLGVGQLYAHSGRDHSGDVDKAFGLFQVRDGKVTRLVVYWDLDRALADLGLAGQAVSQDSTTLDLAEVAARSRDATKRKDVDAIQGFWGPDPILDMSPLGLGVYAGAASIRAFMEDWLGAYDEFELEVEEIRDLGNGVVFQMAVQRGMPRGSMGWLEVRYGAVFTVVDGLAERATYYYDIDEARASAERLAEERA